MEPVLQVVMEAWGVLLSTLSSPHNRLFVGYLFTSAILAGWVYLRSHRHTGFLAFLLPKKVWCSPSIRLDFKLILFNSLVKIFLAGQFVVLSLALAHATQDGLTFVWGSVSTGMGKVEALVGYSMALLILNDLASYWVHRWMHEIPFLWSIHQVHHSADRLTPFTLLRVHPLELFLHLGRHILVAGVISGLFNYWTSHPLTVVTFLGVNAGNALFFAWGANLRHSHVKLTYWKPLECIFVSPHQHQIHHSTDPAHHQRNYGSKFALWDWAMGTLVLSSEGDALSFGVRKAEERHTTLRQALLAPVRALSPRDRPTQASANSHLPVQ